MESKAIQMIDAPEALEKVKAGALLVDVRTPKEHSEGHLAGSLNIDSGEAEARLANFGDDKEREIVLYCKAGGRAGRIAELLNSHGYRRVFNAGGYDDLKSTFSE